MFCDAVSFDTYAGLDQTPKTVCHELIAGLRQVNRLHCSRSSGGKNLQFDLPLCCAWRAASIAVGYHQKRAKHSRTSLMRTESCEHVPDEPQNGSRGRQPMPLLSYFWSDVLKNQIQNPSTGKKHHN